MKTRGEVAGSPRAQYAAVVLVVLCALAANASGAAVAADAAATSSDATTTSSDATTTSSDATTTSSDATAALQETETTTAAAAGAVEGRGHYKKMMMNPYMLIPQLIALGFAPIVLANLKMMVMSALMINNMALNAAIFMTVRNIVFGPRPKVKYVNYGYRHGHQHDSGHHHHHHRDDGLSHDQLHDEPQQQQQLLQDDEAQTAEYRRRRTSVEGS